MNNVYLSHESELLGGMTYVVVLMEVPFGRQGVVSISVSEEDFSRIVREFGLKPVLPKDVNGYTRYSNKY